MTNHKKTCDIYMSVVVVAGQSILWKHVTISWQVKVEHHSSSYDKRRWHSANEYIRCYYAQEQLTAMQCDFRFDLFFSLFQKYFLVLVFEIVFIIFSF